MFVCVCVCVCVCATIMTATAVRTTTATTTTAALIILASLKLIKLSHPVYKTSDKRMEQRKTYKHSTEL